MGVEILERKKICILLLCCLISFLAIACLPVSNAPEASSSSASLPAVTASPESDPNTNLLPQQPAPVLGPAGSPSPTAEPGTPAGQPEAVLAAQDYLAEPIQLGERISLAGLLQREKGTPPPKDLSPEETAELARQHLAARLGLALDVVTVESIEAAEWEDLNLGCAAPAGMQPDRAFARLIPGHIILLSASETTHEYHSGGLWLVYCGKY